MQNFTTYVRALPALILAATLALACGGDSSTGPDPGPGTITVAYPGVISMKVNRVQQVRMVRTAPKLAPRPPVRRLPTKATGWAALTK